MTDKTKPCKANESAVCCCVDIGTTINNEDCAITYENTFTTKKEAQHELTRLTNIAKEVESEPCSIEHQIEETEGGYKLLLQITFCCGAESMIFQFKIR